MFRPLPLRAPQAASTGSAGSNAGGSVELSWDASALRSSPSASGQRVFPLYVSLKDIPDLSQLAHEGFKRSAQLIFWRTADGDARQLGFDARAEIWL